MPVNLTTPVDIQAQDSGNTSHAKIVMQRHDSRNGRISLRVQWGNMVDGEFVGLGLTQGFVIQGQDYIDIVANSVPDVQTSDPSDAVTYAQVGAVWVEKTYYATKRALYAWLQAEGHIGAGSVE